MSASPNPEWVESFPNEGKGIQVSLCFTGLIPKPTGADIKWKKKYKEAQKDFVFHIHKDSELEELLETAINTMDCHHLEWTIGNHSGLLDADNFSITYTIPINSSHIHSLSLISGVLHSDQMQPEGKDDLSGSGKYLKSPLVGS